MKETVKNYCVRSVPGEPDWEAVPRLEVDQVLWKPDCGIRASGRFCHDSLALYVNLRAAEKQIRAEYTAPLSPVCRDSCLEFFFMPEDEDRYFNFEINPNGCLYIGFGRGREDSTALYRENMRQLFGIRTESELLCRKGEKNEYGQFMYFENLTYVPIDLDAVDAEALTSTERKQLNDYHAMVYEAMAPLLTEDERSWLREATRAI